jgi:hypothetical protein
MARRGGEEADEFFLNLPKSGGSNTPRDETEQRTSQREEATHLQGRSAEDLIDQSASEKDVALHASDL